MGGSRVDIIVVGLGHAGCEAALAAARLGLQTLALTLDDQRIGVMSCNPAIGGSAKSQLVRELDALGGEMARAADAAGIQFRRLNAGRGPAVRANRVLCDRARYAAEMRRRVYAQPGLTVLQGEAWRLVADRGRVEGVELPSGERVLARAVVLTTGTFLAGKLHLGAQNESGGRRGDAASLGISASLRKLGLEVGRFKTGTPPRLWARSIDFSRTRAQPGDTPPLPLSAWTPAASFPALPQIPCHLTHTQTATHAVVRDNLGRSPLYQGRIEGRGPRYCPSLEDKVVRFPDRERHQVFLEPEGLESPLIYPAGLSTSLPEDVQLDVLRTIPGLEQVEIAQAGYAVEYDYVPATQLDRRLAARGVEGLFLAGQINGTSGYEEAAVQGLWAGVNAARWVQGRPAWRASRDLSHAAVLIDELVEKRIEEPLRMFTSRSENRLELRESNADLRLSPAGAELGLLTPGQGAQVEARRRRIALEKERLAAAPSAAGSRLIDDLARPEVSYADLAPGPDALAAPLDREELEAQVKYAGYLRRAVRERALLAGGDAMALPRGLRFEEIAGLSAEARQKLLQHQPRSLGEASRISGVTPAALGVIAAYLARRPIGPPEP